MTYSSSGQLRPVWARLAPTEKAKQQMSKARGRRDAKRALQAAHEELAVTLVPKLENLQQRGLISEFGTSWLLGENVGHGRAENVAEVHKELAGFPELGDVISDPIQLRLRLHAKTRLIGKPQRRRRPISRSSF